MQKVIVFSILVTLSLGQLVQNPCSAPPNNCPDCTMYQMQCFKPTCLEKIARLGSPAAGVGNLDLNLQGAIQFADVNGKKQLLVQVAFDDSESDPFEQSTDGSIQTCVQSVLYRLDNQISMPHNQIGPISFVRGYDNNIKKRLYTFALTVDEISGLIKLNTGKEATELTYQGNYVYEFQVSGKAQGRYYFSFQVTFLRDMTDMLNSNFQAVKEIDSLVCPNSADPNQCVTTVDSELAFCTDFTENCLTESTTSPDLFINMDLYIVHKITTPGFQNWLLNPDQVQFYNIAAGYFQQIDPAKASAWQYNGKTVYKVKISFVQNNVKIGVNSKLVPPTGRRFLRRLLQASGDKSTAASSDEIQCIREKETDSCPVSQEAIDKYSNNNTTTQQTTTNNTANNSSVTNDDSNTGSNSKSACIILSAFLGLFMLALI